jgi:hypothetical protein
MKQNKIFGKKQLYGGALLSALLWQLGTGIFSLTDLVVQSIVVLIGFQIYKKFLIKKIKPKSNVKKAIGVALGTIILQTAFLVLVFFLANKIFGTTVLTIGLMITLPLIVINFLIIFFSYLIIQKVIKK